MTYDCPDRYQSRSPRGRPHSQGYESGTGCDRRDRLHAEVHDWPFWYCATTVSTTTMLGKWLSILFVRIGILVVLGQMRTEIPEIK